MKIIFISALEFGYRCIEAVLKSGWNVGAIFTMDDNIIKNASGYVSFDGLKKYNVDIYKVSDINDNSVISRIKSISPDVIIVLGWSQIVSNEIISIPKLCCLGHHPTLLPKHRGNAPIPWSIIMGLKKSGITFFHLIDKVDAGDIFAQKEFDITLEDNAYSVYQKAINATIDLLNTEILPKLERGIVIRIPQDEKRASYWPKRRPEDGIIDWNMSTINLYNWIRGLSHPYPGAFTYISDKNDLKLTIWEAKLIDSDYRGKPGEILKISDEGIIIGTGDGCLLITRVQPENDIEMSAVDFATKYNIVERITLG